MNMNAPFKVIHLKPLGSMTGQPKNITKVTDLIFIIQQLGQLRNGTGCKISIILQVVKKCYKFHAFYLLQ